MSADRDYTEEEQAMLRKIARLLTLAGNTPSPEEAASALGKSQELLERLNLDMAGFERAHRDDNRRRHAILLAENGEWGREIWDNIGSLNFCLYWRNKLFDLTIRKLAPEQLKGLSAARLRKANTTGLHCHNLIGREINIQSTIAMAGYLENALNRMVSEYCRRTLRLPNSDWVKSYRSGAADAVIAAIVDRRENISRREADAIREQANEISEMAQTASLSTALTLTSVTQTEFEANYDLACGPGAWAKRQAKRKQEEAIDAERLARRTKWAAANPEKARAAEERRRERQQAAEDRLVTKRIGAGGNTAYLTGHRDGKKISLDVQVDTDRQVSAGALTHQTDQTPN